ncbi:MULTISPECIES: WXG100 family type VII secretion target [Actinoalloteichus]|uniref:Uncharacterized protein n=1 Tax=Actinoalloteichus fjordicus TaxID=1612552 RepID=A0AAC9PQ05_9PSEU|nr:MULTISPECIES: hypothetical protein [Actinoalloteichus]APU12575.1 hypothetical protein UA74_02440 [Actinoalloteichus fjordicus]APU18528.1 hypothetical protein UA75_02445 [Actinoalloteichus sp. GBA129-24]
MSYAPAEAIVLAEPSAGDSAIKDKVEGASLQVQAVDWIWQQVTGQGLVEMVITPLLGDFGKMKNNGEAWKNAADALQVTRNNLNTGLDTLLQTWKGPAADSFNAKIGQNWTLSIEADAQMANLAGLAFDQCAKTSEKMCDEALKLVEKLVNKLIEAIALAPIPVVGWAKAVKTVYDAVTIVNSILNIISAITSMVESTITVINGLIGLGSAVMQVGDVNDINSALNVANQTGDSVAQVAEGTQGFNSAQENLQTEVGGNTRADGTVDNEGNLNRAADSFEQNYGAYQQERQNASS